MTTANQMLDLDLDLHHVAETTTGHYYIIKIQQRRKNATAE